VVFTCRDGPLAAVGASLPPDSELPWIIVRFIILKNVQNYMIRVQRRYNADSFANFFTNVQTTYLSG